MFNKKEVAPSEPQTKCETCGAYIDKINEVKVVRDIFTMFEAGDIRYYCNTHKKPYEKEYQSLARGSVYFAKLEVTKDGTPVGYVKIKEKKA